MNITFKEVRTAFCRTPTRETVFKDRINVRLPTGRQHSVIWVRDKKGGQGIDSVIVLRHADVCKPAACSLARRLFASQWLITEGMSGISWTIPLSSGLPKQQRSDNTTPHALPCRLHHRLYMPVRKPDRYTASTSTRFPQTQPITTTRLTSLDDVGTFLPVIVAPTSDAIRHQHFSLYFP